MPQLAPLNWLLLFFLFWFVASSIMVVVWWTVKSPYTIEGQNTEADKSVKLMSVEGKGKSVWRW
uniref:ATP synthase F0 subunit 8 n=1 Tax=Phasianella solida TaxID=335754 RepID=A0A0S1F5Q1_9VEST|nr:ATP synthase F0 subunit 8 [Phasianella solida]ALK03391.1 ATP synthase F0 subunit 8 [Phasianella solida]